MIETLPQNLIDTGRFCCWRKELRDSGKIGKVPYNPRTGRKAQSSNPETFSTLQQALTACRRYGFDGIGVGLFNGLCAIDIDDCIQDNQLTPMAREIMQTMHSYTEVSPSGTGIHILFTVSPQFRMDTTRYYVNNWKIGLEVYVSGSTNHYMTLTGRAHKGCAFGDRSEELQDVLDEWMKKPAPQAAVSVPQVCGLDDQELLQKAMSNPRTGYEFSRLWNGDWEGVVANCADTSHSNADFKFCMLLAFWTGKDASRIDRLFRMSGMYRPKWERSSYRNSVINGAIRMTKNTYTGTPAAGAERNRVYGWNDYLEAD